MLHNETEIFEQLILRTSEYLNIKPEIIEKDYFVTVFLKKLIEKSNRQPHPNVDSALKKR